MLGHTLLLQPALNACASWLEGKRLLQQLLEDSVNQSDNFVDSCRDVRDILAECAADASNQEIMEEQPLSRFIEKAERLKEYLRRVQR
jgi:hypothetical protein